MPAAYLFHVPVQVASALYFLGKENLGTMRMARIALMFLFVFGVISSNIRAKKARTSFSTCYFYRLNQVSK